MDRAEIVHDAFLARVSQGDLPSVTGRSVQAGLSSANILSLFKAQVMSRQLDRMSRRLQARGQGFYTIGSSGHEGNAAVAAALRSTDPAFLHYRDAAFQIARAGQVDGQNPLRDMLLSFTASSDDPISGGRHKVLGSKVLSIPPQTSTIASHLPKAVGAAYSIGLARRCAPLVKDYPGDAIVLCSFGDASLNHSTAQGALNTAGWTAWQGVPLPLIFLCEDNGIGISTKTPQGWSAAVLQSRPGLTYLSCNGLDIVDTYRTAKQAADHARKQRKPVILHMSCVRLYGHAGPDVEVAYRPQSEIDAAERNDPLIHTAARLIAEEVASAEEVISLYTDIGEQTEAEAEKAVIRPKLQTAKQVMASLIPPTRPVPKRNAPSEHDRAGCFGTSDMRAMGNAQPMNKLINLCLTDLMLEHPDIVMAGEDIGRKGGVYGITKGLQGRFGASRVIDTLLDEQSILGLSIGMAQNGFTPIPEIQFLAYLHNAEDQVRGEAATLPFFSNGQYTNPMVIRIAGLGYQKGFGGHFHNDNSFAVLRDIPGVAIACPSDGAEAVRLMREAVRLAREEQRVVVILEPIALYPIRDLHEEGDGLWMRTYPDAGELAPLDQVATYGTGNDLAIVTYGNGIYFSRQAERTLSAAGHKVRIVDLRWLAPLADAAILKSTQDCAKILIVDECRRTGSQSEALMTLFSEAGRTGVARITAEDSFIATGPAYGATLPSAKGITEAALSLLVE